MDNAVVSFLTLGVSDFSRQLEFYRDGLGLDLRKMNDNPEHPYAFFAIGGMTLALYPKVLLEYVSGRSGMAAGNGSQSISINVASQHEVDAVVERARKAGAVISRDGYQPPWGGYCAYFTDPEGFMWEVAWHPSF